MDTCLIPQQVSQREAALMVAVRGVAQAPSLAVRGDGRALPVTLSRWPSAGPTLAWFGRVRFDALAPDTRHRFTLTDAARELDVAHVTTLPQTLGGPDRPLPLLLASCYSRSDDAGVGEAILSLPPALRPRAKLLCGDQVYADTGRVRWGAGIASLRRALLDTYWRSFDQRPRGFGDVLREGGNFFVSDDHEFWNNAPFASIVAWRTLDGDYRRDYFDAAAALYRAWQGDYPGLHGFDVGPLSLRLLDTRLHRDAKRQRFASAEDEARLAGWVAGLDGAGVLVLGQPLFAEPARDPDGIAGDATLASYAQYARVLRILGGTRRPLVLLSGDVHFGRAARCTLPGNVQVVEILSSPLAQLTLARGRFSSAPQRLTASDGSAFHARDVVTEADFRSERDHFVTLELWSVGERVHLSAKRWRVSPARAVPEAVLAPGGILRL